MKLIQMLQAYGRFVGIRRPDEGSLIHDRNRFYLFLLVIHLFLAMCALGILLACFSFTMAFGYLADIKLDCFSEDYGQNGNDAKMINGFRDLYCFAMEIRGCSIFFVYL